jgi:ammonia channel protein AmtB
MTTKLSPDVFPLRAPQEDESVGLDISMHGEEGYVHAQGSTAIHG